MANRYWVGGTASWDGTAGTKWAATSGGAGGASVPTTADDVFFDASSTGTVTIAAGNTGAKSINCTGFTGTITGSSDMTVAGSITLVAGMTYTHSGTITITGTSTLVTAGKTFSFLIVNAPGSTVTLGDALSVGARQITITQGTFNTANYNVTAGALASSTTNTRTITLGSSTVALSSSATALDFATSTNLTFNADTSQINLSNGGTSFRGGSLTFYNVSFTATTGTRQLSGANTFNNLTLGSPSSLSTGGLIIHSDQTVNGTFTCSTTAATGRNSIRSITIGTAITITAATLSADNCDFRDITIAGGAANTAPTRAGDCGGNSGIVFPAAKTVYRVGSSSSWTGSNSWALTANGTGSDNNYPLPQDTIVFDDNSTYTGTMFMLAGNFGSLDCSNRTTTITLTPAGGARFHGSVTLGSGLTAGASYSFSGRGTMNITTAGKTMGTLFMEGPGGTLRLNDAVNSTGSISLTNGTFDANNYNVTCSTVSASGTSTRTLTMGSGLWTLSGTGSVWNASTTTGLTFNKNTANILLSNTTTTARNFLSGGLAYNKLTIGGTTGTSTTTLTGAGSYTELASTKTVAHTITFFEAQGTIDTWSVTGTPGNVVTLNSSTSGTQRTFTLTNATSGIDYLSVKDIGELSGSKFAVGANSTDGGNNTNVYFSATPPVVVTTGNMMMLFH